MADNENPGEETAPAGEEQKENVVAGGEEETEIVNRGGEEDKEIVNRGGEVEQTTNMPGPSTEPEVESSPFNVPEEVRPEGQQITTTITSPDDAAGFPLADSAVLMELKEMETRARKATVVIEVLRKELIVSMQKDEMTAEDLRILEQKQKELMEKMQELEDITKSIQRLVGLVEVASSQLGPPQKHLAPVVEGVKAVRPGKPQSLPGETLPKVIICGTSDVDQVPKIIVCEPASAKGGKSPKYNENKGRKVVSKTTVQDSAIVQPQQGSYPGYQVPQGFQGPQGCQVPPYLGAMGPMRQFGDGGQMGMMPGGAADPGMMQPWMLGPGIAPSCMAAPGMAQPGMISPGMLQQGTFPPGLIQPAMNQMMVMPMPCSPCVKHCCKKHRSHKSKEAEGEMGMPHKMKDSEQGGKKYV